MKTAVSLLLLMYATIASAQTPSTQIINRITTQVSDAAKTFEDETKAIIGKNPKRIGLSLKDYDEVSVKYQKSVTASLQQFTAFARKGYPFLSEFSNQLDGLKTYPLNTDNQIKFAYEQLEKTRVTANAALNAHIQKALKMLMVGVMEGYPYSADYSTYPAMESCLYLASGQLLGCDATRTWEKVDGAVANDPIFAVNAAFVPIDYFHTYYAKPMLSGCRSSMCVALHFADVKDTIQKVVDKFQNLTVALDVPAAAKAVMKSEFKLYGALPATTHLQKMFDGRDFPGLPLEDQKK